jgi:predicted RNase H-like nuclease (RuvC/YqgF family)
MTNNKLPVIGKRYSCLDFDQIILLECVLIDGDDIVMKNIELIDNFSKYQEFDKSEFWERFDTFEELPDQEPTTELYGKMPQVMEDMHKRTKEMNDIYARRLKFDKEQADFRKEVSKFTIPKRSDFKTDKMQESLEERIEKLELLAKNRASDIAELFMRIEKLERGNK